jgi:drug/metabolite transporter (DMT)-like permease
MAISRTDARIEVGGTESGGHVTGTTTLGAGMAARSIGPAFAALCIGALAMGISPIFVRWVSGDVGPFASAFWRVALALPVLYAWARLEASGPLAARPTRAELLAGAAFAGDLFFWHLAILGTTVANATFFATTAPVFVVLVTWLVLRRPIGSATVAGLALCLLGGAALIGETLRATPGHLLGDLYGVGTAFFFALYFLAVSRARGEGAGAGRVTFVLSLATAAILLVVALALDPGAFWPTSAATWGTLILLGLVSHAGGQGLLAIALGRLPATFSSLVIFLEAICAAIAGWLLLGEALGIVQACGGLLILAGIWVARPRRAATGIPGTSRP